MKSILAIPVITILVLMSSCNSDMDSSRSGHLNDPMIPPHSARVQETATDNSIGQQVRAQQVCMVNDTYMGKDQIAVPVNGKTYYGCCQMCVSTLNEQSSSRRAKDPMTEETVDKAEAFIVVLDPSGSVGYFKNEVNYQLYQQNRRENK